MKRGGGARETKSCKEKEREGGRFLGVGGLAARQLSLLSS